MSEKTSAEILRFILPFSIPSENRKESFTEDMEKAAVFCLSEIERAKGGGLILKQPEEKIEFISKSCYPFWVVAWNKINLVFDGLNTLSHTLTYKTIPDVKTFMEGTERSSKSQETYVAFLSDNINYFQTPTIENQIVLNGLMTEPTFLNEFSLYVSDTSKMEPIKSDAVLPSSTLDEHAISSMVAELETLKLKFSEEVTAFYKAMKLLNKSTRNYVKAIRGKIKEIKEEFDVEIKKQEEIVTPKVNRINKEYDEQISKLAKEFEKQLLPLQKEKVKLEKIKVETLTKIERYKLEAKTSATSKDEVSERKWKEKISDTKKELSEIEAQIREVERKIKDVEENHSLETFKLRSEWENKIKEAKKDLLELEASRDAKIELHKMEMGKLENLTYTIIGQIDAIAKSRSVEIAAFEKLGIPQKYAKCTIVCVPFYVAYYVAGTKRRCIVFSPSIINSVSLFAKLKGALGMAKIKQLFNPRFKAITAFLNRFPSLLEKDAVFQREISEASDKVNMLKASVAKEQILDGLKRLKDEGWFSEKEYEAFKQQLQQ